MSLTEQQTALLNAKLDPENVRKPSGQYGPKGDYIEGWHAIAEANRIFGFDGWAAETVDLVENHAPVTRQDGKFEVSFRARVRVVVSGITRDGVGFGSGFAKNIGDAYEGAIKEAETDAFKRAMRTFGNVFGLALYDKSRANVGVDAPAIDKSTPFDDAPSKPARATPPANANSGPLTPAGRQRRAGERLTDANDVQTIMEALLENVTKKGDPDSLKKWATGQRAQIASLPDKAFDEFMDAYEREMDELIAGRVFA
ncbi:RAD52 family DNA repair protein [Aurantimonas coralicida]|uniref:RAD52 family DNA repair protein n=1 Tax=Aurantimonas coralicida TaxID=182270 RepID=UPI001E49AF14|nr:RAD52 family DNA repair protein [Aurantimonas coralicida]MCD1645216.1 RAD52 family DNA repair protein [Aurantimonas coralicida]